MWVGVEHVSRVEWRERGKVSIYSRFRGRLVESRVSCRHLRWCVHELNRGHWSISKVKEDYIVYLSLITFNIKRLFWDKKIFSVVYNCFLWNVWSFSQLKPVYVKNLFLIFSLLHNYSGLWFLRSCPPLQSQMSLIVILDSQKLK